MMFQRYLLLPSLKRHYFVCVLNVDYEAVLLYSLDMCQRKFNLVMFF